MPNELFLLSGPSGVGKTTIAQELLKQLPNMERLVTYTTRPPRPNEQSGVDYHFISAEEFEEKISNNEMFEYDEHYGNLYGNSRHDLDEIWQNNKIALMVLDVNGVKTAKKYFPEAKTIFVLPDTLPNLEGRIRNRPMTEEAFKKRWAMVHPELAEADQYDFQVVNQENQLAEAVQAVKNIIINPA
ncbi:MAG: guanylate kinase [Patescibacteria group bacterium]